MAGPEFRPTDARVAGTMDAPLRVLLAENSEDDEVLVRRALAKGGLSVIIDRVASRETLARALDYGTHDIVLSDYSMPELSPHDVLAALAERKLDIPLILVTGTIGENRAASIMRAGAHDFILKDDLSRLVPAMQRELREAEGRRARRELEYEWRKLSRVVEQTADAVLLTDPTGRIEYANPAASRQTGYSEAELVGATPAIFRSGFHDALFYQNLWDTLFAGQEFRAVFTNRRKNGEHYFEAKTLTPFKDEAGAIVGFISTGRDVSELVHVREDLQRSLSILTATLESTADAIVVTDLHRNIVHFNQQYCDLWGWTGAPGRSWAEREKVIMALVCDPEPQLEVVGHLYERPEETRSDVWTLRDGRAIEYYSQPQRLGEEVIGRVWSFRDVTDRVRHERHLVHVAYHDPVTDLPNRRFLEEHLGECFVRARTSRAFVAVVLLGIDRFSLINETLGHRAGDDILMATASRLAAGLPASAILARTGGSEFVVVQEVANGDEGADLAARLRAAVGKALMVQGKELFLTASVGVGLYPEDATDPYVLLQHADSAMARALRDGGDMVARYRPHMSSDAAQRLATEHALHRALAQEEFVLHYQPQVCLKTGRVVGVEALIRWRDPKLGLIPPGRFIGIAEDTGLIVPITEWVLATACTQAVRWRRQGLPEMAMAVNISARLFNYGDLLQVVDRTLQATGLGARFLEIEITEGVIMQDLAHTIEILQELRRRGVRSSVDDFGTGYCALGYLREFPLDVLKIDRSFVERLGSDLRDEVVTKTIIHLAHTFSLSVVAEGAETVAQVRRLMALDCDVLQGYYFARPLPAEECEQLLARPQPFVPPTADIAL